MRCHATTAGTVQAKDSSKVLNSKGVRCDINPRPKIHEATTALLPPTFNPQSHNIEIYVLVVRSPQEAQLRPEDGPAELVLTAREAAVPWNKRLMGLGFENGSGF